MSKKQKIIRIIIILAISLVVAIQPIGTRKGILVEGFDTETKKSIKSAKHNYFNQNYKP